METVVEILLRGQFLVQKEISDERKIFLVIHRVQIADILQLEGGGPVRKQETFTREDAVIARFFLEKVEVGRSHVGIAFLARKPIEPIVSGRDEVRPHLDSDQCGEYDWQVSSGEG